jgi:arginase family enzyme
MSWTPSAPSAFTGTRGGGKTTELHRLEETLRHDPLTVFMDVAELLNRGDIQYMDLLVLQASRRSVR